VRRAPSSVPFFASAALTAVAALGVLSARGDGRAGAPSAPSAAAAVGGAAYVDHRIDVPHRGEVTPRAALSAIDWLRRHQYSEGMWSARSYTQMCEGKVCVGRGGDEHDVGVTALAALALLESGLAREKYEEAVHRALGWLARTQDESGCFGPRQGKFMYGHAIATLAFARAYTLLGEGIFKHHAARGVRFLELARNPGLAWRYGVRDGENDTSVTAWAGAALLAAASPDVEVAVDGQAFQGIRRWLAEMTGEWHYEVSYMRRGGGNARVRGGAERHTPNEGLTASGLWLRLELGEDRAHPPVSSAARRLGWNLPVWDGDGSGVDYGAWYSGTRALAAYGDPELWSVWSSRILRVLVSRQRRFNEGCLAGSWDAADKWGAEGGRVYATAMNLLTLGVVHRARPAAR
jgi:hypothetical protein